MLLPGLLILSFNRVFFVIQLQAASEYANTSTPFRQSRESPYEQVLFAFVIIPCSIVMHFPSMIP